MGKVVFPLHVIRDAQMSSIVFVIENIHWIKKRRGKCLKGKECLKNESLFKQNQNEAKFSKHLFIIYL